MSKKTTIEQLREEVSAMEKHMHLAWSSVANCLEIVGELAAGKPIDNEEHLLEEDEVTDELPDLDLGDEEEEEEEKKPTKKKAAAKKKAPAKKKQPTQKAIIALARSVVADVPKGNAKLKELLNEIDPDATSIPTLDKEKYADFAEAMEKLLEEQGEAE